MLRSSTLSSLGRKCIAESRKRKQLCETEHWYAGAGGRLSVASKTASCAGMQRRANRDVGARDQRLPLAHVEDATDRLGLGEREEHEAAAVLAMTRLRPEVSRLRRTASNAQPLFAVACRLPIATLVHRDRSLQPTLSASVELLASQSRRRIAWSSAASIAARISATP